MTLFRRLSARVILVGLFASLVGFLCAALATGALLRQNQRVTLDALRLWATRTGPQLCEQSPEHWSFRLPFGARAFAYDARSLQSLNAEADPLPFAASDLPQQVGEALTHERTLRGGRLFALRARASGPCSLIAVSWPRRSLLEDPALAGCTVFVLSALPISWLGFLLVIRPLARRVQTLSHAAAAMGSAEYSTEARARGDELDGIRVGMDHAHARIVVSTEKLANRLRALQEHLTNVAHDLRTPLASLQAQVEEALDSHGAGETELALRGALRDCVYLSGLTENLRLESQLDEGWDPAEAPALDLGLTVTRIVERLGHYAKRRQIQLNYAVPERPILVLCDSFACEQALSNIIENAISHLPASGQIGVLLDGLPDGAFVLTVVDDGPGVDLPDLERLGQRAFRTDGARARDPRGSGLGLAIAATVCERCHWQVQFSRASEGGLSVELRGRAASPG